MLPVKHCRIEVADNAIVVTPLCDLGELASEIVSEEMQGVLQILDQQRARNVVVDFSHTDFFGSDMIYLLLKIHRRVIEQKGLMAFCGLSSNEREVLSLMALDSMWTVRTSCGEALEFVGRQAIGILVVDDSEVDRCLVGGLLVGNPDYRVSYATSGKDALTQMRQSLPDLVISDLVMPEMNGLELVTAVRQAYPLIPVILLTAHGNESIALEALERGAASYVPKSQQSARLQETVERVVMRIRAYRRSHRLEECPANMDLTFYLGNDPAVIRPTVDLIQHNLSALGLGDAMDQVRIAIALEEALENALYHGNLEISAEELARVRSPGSAVAVSDLVGERRHRCSICDRRIVLDVQITPHTARFVIRDQGQGFDPRQVSRAAQHCFENGWNRGTMLMSTLMDEMTYNAIGNQVTLVKVPSA
jgi:CheY-like chemotaxis protein/anti-sigma regulatory factor (Ser/Thr protein kinase)